MTQIWDLRLEKDKLIELPKSYKADEVFLLDKISSR